MWFYVNWIQIIRPNTLLQTNITNALSDYLNDDMQMFNLQIPYFVDIGSIIDGFIGDTEYNMPSTFSAQCDAYSFEVGKFALFLISNILTLISFFAGFGTLYFVSLLIMKVKYKCINQLGNKLKMLAWNSLFFNLSIRIFQEITLEGYLHSLIFIRFFDIKGDLLRNIVGTSLSVIILMSSVVFIISFYKKLRNPENWNSKFKELYEGMYPKGLNVSAYFIIFFLKRFLISVTVSLREIAPSYVQNFMILIAHFSSLCLSVCLPPFENKFDMCIVLMLEVAGVFYSIPLFYFDSLLPEQRVLGRRLIQLFM